MEIELKLCPFCGSKAVVVEAVDEPGAWKVFCMNPDCDAQYGWCADREYTIKGWNRRAKSNEVGN